MNVPINFRLLKTPANWFIVLLTLLIGGFALHAIRPSTSDNS